MQVIINIHLAVIINNWDDTQEGTVNAPLFDKIVLWSKSWIKFDRYASGVIRAV